MNHFGLKKASSWTQVSSVRAKRPFIYLPLWARHSMQVQTGEEAAEGRKCEGGAVNGSGRESVHDTNLRSVGEQNRCQVGPTILLRAPRPDPPLRPMQKEAELNAVNHGIVVTLGITPRNY